MLFIKNYDYYYYHHHYNNYYNYYYSLLSRNKDILSGLFELKGKEELVVFCDLSNLQQQLYKYILSLPDFENIKKSEKKCNCGSNISPRSCCCPHHVIPLM